MGGCSHILSPPQHPLSNTHPHALKSGQCPQRSQGPERAQGFDGPQLRVAQPVSHQANDGDLEEVCVQEVEVPGFLLAWDT